jgi:hypothetical protein
MKHLANYKKFNEEVEMGFLPTDVVKHSGEVLSDLLSSSKSMISSMVSKFGSKLELPEEEVQNIRDFLKENFGTTKVEPTKENFMKMSSILGIEMKNEKLYYIDELKDGESLAVKIMYSLKQYGKINLFTGGIPNAVIINLLTSLLSTTMALDFKVTAILGMILGFVLWGLFSIILSFYGYVRHDNSGLTYYSRSDDFRRK